MNKPSNKLILLCGILSPFVAVLFSIVVDQLLRLRSGDIHKDWLFRLVCATAAMPIPFLITLKLAVSKYRLKALLVSGKIGLALGILSLGLMAKPITDGFVRARQERNQAMHDVSAPLFTTVDITGKTQALADYRGQVVLVNIWATWCEPCRSEMPKLEQLYQSRKGSGFVILGLSDESVETQKKFLQQVPVSYPLLTVSAGVPSLYRDIAKYPAMFLIDRQGRLQPAPESGQEFEKISDAVDGLLKDGRR